MGGDPGSWRDGDRARLGLDHLAAWRKKPPLAASRGARSCPLTLLSLTALALKSLDYETVPINLIKDGGQQVRRPPVGRNVGVGSLGEGPSRGCRFLPPRR